MKNIESFINNATLHGEGTEEGNSDKTNAAFDALILSYKEIKREDPELKSLLPSLNHENESVKMWAAFLLLRVDEEKATDTLREVADKDGLVAFSAQATLDEWKAGNLKFDFLEA